MVSSPATTASRSSTVLVPEWNATIAEELSTIENSVNKSDLYLTCDEVALVRILSLTFTFAATLFLCYVIAALSIYAHKKKFMIRCGELHRSAADHAAVVVNSITLLGAVFVLFYVGAEIPMVTSPNSWFCSHYHRMKIVTFALAAFSLYFALWYKVFKVFYRNEILKRGMSKLLQVINISALPFLFAMVISNLVLFLSAPTYISAGCGCKPVQSTENNTIKWAVLFTCTFTFQIILLFSFIYPLYLHRKKMLSQGFDHKSVIPVVKRAAIVAAFCVVSDLFNSLFAIVYAAPTVYINHIVFSCTLLVNLIGTILSFTNWRDKLLPFGDQLRPLPVTKQTTLPSPGLTAASNTNKNVLSEPVVTTAWT